MQLAPFLKRPSRSLNQRARGLSLLRGLEAGTSESHWSVVLECWTRNHETGFKSSLSHKKAPNHRCSKIIRWSALVCFVHTGCKKRACLEDRRLTAILKGPWAQVHTVISAFSGSNPLLGHFIVSSLFCSKPAFSSANSLSQRLNSSYKQSKTGKARWSAVHQVGLRGRDYRVAGHSHNAL